MLDYTNDQQLGVHLVTISWHLPFKCVDLCRGMSMFNTLFKVFSVRTLVVKGLNWVPSDLVVTNLFIVKVTLFVKIRSFLNCKVIHIVEFSVAHWSD